MERNQPQCRRKFVPGLLKKKRNRGKRNRPSRRRKNDLIKLPSKKRSRRKDKRPLCKRKSHHSLYQMGKHSQKT